MADSPFVPLPEDLPPPGVILPQDCELARQGSRIVWGEGNPDAPMMFVLDNPGARENTAGDPYVCGARTTLRQAMDDAGLPEADAYITYLLKRRPRRAYDRQAAWRNYVPLLDEQVRAKSPLLIVTFGGVVAHAWLGLDPEVPENELKRIRGTWHEKLGHPVLITYHPLAARRRPNLYPYLVQDLRQAAERLASLQAKTPVPERLASQPDLAPQGGEPLNRG